MSGSVTVAVGQTLSATINGHSTTNGAPIPDTSVVLLTSDNPAVVAVPPTVTVPAGGATSIPNIPLTVVGVGTANISLTVTAVDGTALKDSASATVTPAVGGGLASVELVLALSGVTPATASQTLTARGLTPHG